MSHYHDTDDLKVVGEFKKLAPAEFKGFVELNAIVGREDGKILRKYHATAHKMGPGSSDP
jgi:hypothetical protein